MYQVGGSKDSPSIILDETNASFRIIGPSFSENAILVYEPVLDWIDQYLPLLTKQMKCEFDFFYLNSSSKRAIYGVMKKLEDFYLEGKKLTIVWNFEKFDDDMLEQGQEYADILTIPFEFMPKS